MTVKVDTYPEPPVIVKPEVINELEPEVIEPDQSQK